MGDLKTTQERRDQFRTWLHDDTRDHLSIRAWCVAEDACHDVDTLLAENARLRLKLEAMHRRAQKAEGELAKIGGEPGGLAFLRNEHSRRGCVDTENARLRAEVERLRGALALAQSVLRALADCDDAINAGGVPPLSRAEVAAAARAALGEP